MRAESSGEAGQTWMNGLDHQVSDLENRWGITAGDIHEGGSEALVMNARFEDGREAVLKLCLPDSTDIVKEAELLKLAAGRGYAAVLAHDEATGALLLEKLGEKLSDVVEDEEAQIRVLCETMKAAWISLESSPGLTTGAEKAVWLRDFINEKWELLGQPCNKKTIQQAIVFSKERESAHSDENAVLVHGDAHANNALLVPGSDSSNVTCKFIDPDGLFAEKACDLAVPMRDWNTGLLEGATIELAKERCQLLSDLTGVDYESIWQWGFVERVSTGLVLIEIGMVEEGEMYLAIADRLAS